MGLGEVWQRLTAIAGQADPTVLAAGLAALVLVAWTPSWRVLRGVVTIAHEGGHAVAAALTGRTLLGIRLHADASGLTLSRGRARGPGMVVTLAAGYPAPALLGLGGAALLGAGRTAVLLWTATGLLAVLLLLVRNVYGVVSVLATGGVLLGLSWYASTQVQAVAGLLLTWFLLLAAPRPVAELARLHRFRGARHSDADQLARLTHLPTWLWILLFGAVTLAAAVIGAWGLVLGDR